ncbi:labile enterotoxin output A, partial [Salmonella enterica subsp. enterica serovar Weltevreden]|nr:labile enterotoxin output A [Salmonella enterica subsp. enterica serovar Weltevreden]
IVENFEKQRQDFLALINSEIFKEDFFPSYLLLKEQQQELQGSLHESRERQQRFQAWRAEAETIDAEFRALD